MTRPWLEPAPVSIPPELAAAVGGHPLVAETLARRGILTPAAAHAFLDPDAYTPAPTEALPGLLPAVERLEAAIRAREPICVWGDFDVDGQTATTLLVSTLRDLGAAATYHIPVRETEGHGVGLPALRQVIDAGARLILTCDTGIAAVEAAADAHARGVDFIVTGAGFSRDIYGYVRDFGMPVISICDQPGLAKIAQKLGAAAIIVEGKEAGGHLGTDRPTREVLPAVVDAVSIPVIAAGGIWTGEDMEEMFKLGASGVQMATRFVCTHECEAAPEFKQAYINARKEDITVIKSPVGMPGRAIRNKFLDRVESGEPIKFKCPLLCLKTCKAKDANYCIADALINAYQGRVDEGIIFAGENAWRSEKIVSVKDIFDDLLSHFELDEERASATGGSVV